MLGCVAVGAWALIFLQLRFVSILSLGGGVWLVGIVARAIITSVKRVSAEGLERGDGHRFKWADLMEVKDVVHRGNTGSAVWETKLRFKDGRSARLSRTYIGNYYELRSYVSSITRAASRGINDYFHLKQVYINTQGGNIVDNLKSKKQSPPVEDCSC